MTSQEAFEVWREKATLGTDGWQEAFKAGFLAGQIEQLQKEFTEKLKRESSLLTQKPPSNV